MLIIGCDYHRGFQQIAGVDTDTGELTEHRLAHREEAEAFYRVVLTEVCFKTCLTPPTLLEMGRYVNHRNGRCTSL